MVSDTFKVVDRMQIQGNLSCLCRIHLSFCELNQIFTQTAFILIDQVLFSLDFVKLVLLIVI